MSLARRASKSMSMFLFLNSLYPLEVNGMPNSDEIQFSLIEESKMENFEKKLLTTLDQKIQIQLLLLI